MEENRQPQKLKQIVAETCDKVDDGYFESFPPGYRFRPTKEELIYYLKAKVSNETLPRNRIPEINLYHYHPQELTRKQQYTVISFFFFFLIWYIYCYFETILFRYIYIYASFFFSFLLCFNFSLLTKLYVNSFGFLEQ